MSKLIFVLASLFFTAQVVSAGGVTFWEIVKQIDTERGDAKGVSISSTGVIRLSPEFTEVFNTEQPFIFATAADAAGNIYLGSGHEGRVYKVDKNGKGALLLDTEELDVTALATDGGGNVYAGTSPDGKVYRITPDGKSTVFFDPEDKYIWSIVAERNGTVFVGTGDKGVLYKVDASGKSSVHANTNEKHVITLLPDGKGNLLAGTDPGGLVLRIGPDGKMFALLDSTTKEIHKLALGADGTIYALGINATASGEKATSSLPASSPSTSVDGGAVVTISATFEDTVATTTTTSSSNSDTTSAKAILYRITPDGGNDALWTARESVAFGLAVNKNNEVLVGTGLKGRIYSIDPAAKTATLLLQSPEEQSSNLIATANGLYVSSSNIGKLFRIGTDTVKEGTYTSPVHDTKFTATWGRIDWRGNGNMQLQTRSGNTERPDNTWSDWTTPNNNQQVTSPAARFIQWRARLQPGSSLTAVKVAYLQRNVAPEVNSITILQPGVALQEVPQQPVDPGIISAGLDPATFGLPTNIQPRKVFQKGARSIQWAAEDRNGDTLVYAIFYRTTAESEWHQLVTDLKNNYFTLDADALPDGKYLFRVVASDALANPGDRALKGELVSDLVEIDNAPPQVNAAQPRVSGRKVEVVFTASDNLSLLRRAEYSVNGGAWQVAFPDDGIADSRAESYTIKAELPGTGEHIVAFRIYDENANAGGNKVTVKVDK